METACCYGRAVFWTFRRRGYDRVAGELAFRLPDSALDQLGWCKDADSDIWWPSAYAKVWQTLSEVVAWNLPYEKGATTEHHYNRTYRLRGAFLQWVADNPERAAALMTALDTALALLTKGHDAKEQEGHAYAFTWAFLRAHVPVIQPAWEALCQGQAREVASDGKT